MNFQKEWIKIKVALQLNLIPGQTVKEKQKWAVAHGVDGIEISAWDYSPEQLDQARRDFADSPVPISSICGNSSFDFLNPDPIKRRRSIEESKAYLQFAGEFQAVGQISPPIFGPPLINDLSPYKDAVTLEKELLVKICKELGEAAAEANTYFMLEPLNRYEQHLLRQQADAVEIIKKTGHDHIRLISDLFHMNIEETNTPQALINAGPYIKHVHLADNTRLEPGTGTIDFVKAFEALLEVGFDGYMAFECSISGQDKEKALINSLQFVKDNIQKAKKHIYK